MAVPVDDEIVHLERELSEVRRERIALQRQVSERATLETAVERTSRDRSAQSSPAVEEQRERVQEHHDALVESWVAVDRVRFMLDRLRTKYHADLTALDAALAEEATGRDVFAAEVAAAELRLTVPVLDAAGALDG